MTARLLSLLVVLALANTAGAQPPLPEIPRAPSAVRIDGALDADEGWPRARTLALLGLGRGSALPEAKLLRTRQALLVAFRVPIDGLPPLARVSADPGGRAPVLADDALEVRVTTSAGTRRVLASASNAVWHGGATERGVQTASRVAADLWTAELRVPATGEIERLELAVHRRRPTRSFAWPEAPPGARTPEDGACAAVWPEAGRAADFRAAYLPYARKLQVRFDASNVPGLAPGAPARLEVRPERGGRPVLEVDLATDRRVNALHELPELAEGSYRAGVSFPTTPGCPPLAGPPRSFLQRRFGWEHNTLGREDEPLPPLLPVAVAGDAVTTTNRRYEFGPAGLPSAIESDGAAVLARPARWQARVDGREQPIVPTRPLRIRRVSPVRATLDAAFSAGSLRAVLSGSVEEDGLIDLTLALEPEGEARVEALDLVLPLPARRATLLNAITERTRVHWLGVLPDGDGVVWSGKQAGGHAFAPEFVPYVWLGDEARGLAWFAPSTEGWSLAEGVPTQEIVRRDGSVALRVRFFTRPTTLRAPRSLLFGLQATPAKPRPQAPADWRRWLLDCGTRLPALRLCLLGAGTYWGAPTPYAHVTPRPGALELLERARLSGVSNPELVDRYLAFQTFDDAARRRATRDSLRWSVRNLAAQPDAVIAYVNPRGAPREAELAVYRDEWRARPFGDAHGRDVRARGELETQMTESRADYLLWHLDRLLDSSAIDGFFFDNTFLVESASEEVGAGWRDADGTLHAGVDLFAMRDFLRRAQRLVHRRRGSWLNVVHMTSTPIAPLHAWAGMSVGAELRYGLTDYQTRFSREYLRAAALGSQLGTVPVLLDGIRGNASAAERARLERTQAAVAALHENRVSGRLRGAGETIWKHLLADGYGAPEARVHRYWDPEPGFAVEGVDAEALLVSRGGRALALVVGFGEAGRARLRLDPAALDLTAGGRCRDLEGHATAPAEQGAGCSFELPRHEFRLIEYRSGKR